MIIFGTQIAEFKKLKKLRLILNFDIDIDIENNAIWPL